MTTDFSDGLNDDLDLPSDEDREFGRVKPWPEPVDGAELLDEIFRMLRRFIDCPDAFLKRDACWIAATWLSPHPAINCFPLLAVTAPGKGCGKSVYLELLGELVHKPVFTGNVTGAALFRTIDGGQGPTALIDEWDSLSRGAKEEMTNIVNNGYRRKSSKVARSGSKDGASTRGLERYNVWGPKIICGIGRLTGPLRSRCHTTMLQRRAKGKKLETFGPRHRILAGVLNRKLARWQADSFDRFEDALEEARGSEHPLEDRDRDNWVPLWAVGILAGGHWRVTMDRLASALSVVDRGDPEVKEEALRDLLLAFTEYGDTELRASKIIERMIEDQEKRWAHYNGNNRPINANQLAGLVREYGVRSVQCGPARQRHRAYVMDENLLRVAEAHAAPDSDAIPDLRTLLEPEPEGAGELEASVMMEPIHRADLRAEPRSGDAEEETE